MTRAAFIAGQKTGYGVPYAVACRALGVSESWFFKWHGRPATPAQQRRAEVDKAVAEMFAASKGTYGPPRIHRDLKDAGWQVSEKTIAWSMARQGLVARQVKRRRGLTRQDKGKLYLAPAIGLFSRRLPGYAASAHPDAELAGDTIKMAVAVRGGNVAGVIFRTDRGSTYTADEFTSLCARLGITQSMGRVGSCFDNAAAESFFSTLEWEVRSRHHFTTRAEARRVVTQWICDFYNGRRRHSACGMKSPIDFEKDATITVGQ